MRIVVFGAGGFVGGWICEELSQRTDIELIPCVRKWASAVRLARRALRITRADLEDLDDFPALLAGADIVINTALPSPSREAELVTALYSASISAGVRRFIQFSSAAVYGNSTGEVDEGLAPAPIDDYSHGKAKMESRLAEVASRSDAHLFILRPSIVYGPFSDLWTVRYVQRIVKGRWRGLGSLGEGICNLIHAHDLAKAAVAAATVDVAPGVHTLNINGPNAVSWNEYIERLGDTLGISDRVTPNVAILRAMAIAAEAMRIGGKLTTIRSFYQHSAGTTRAAFVKAKGVTELYPTLGELNALGRKVHYSADRASRVLGISPSIPLEEGLSQSVAWCRVHGVV